MVRLYLNKTQVEERCLEALVESEHKKWFFHRTKETKYNKEYRLHHFFVLCVKDQVRIWTYVSWLCLCKENFKSNNHDVTKVQTFSFNIILIVVTHFHFKLDKLT